MNPDDPNNTDLALTPERVGNLDDGSGNVGRIRHILFGNQMRDYDARFQRLEERLAKEAADLRSDVQKRLEDFETFMRGEVESLTGRLRNEHNDRASAQEKLARDLADAGRDLSGIQIQQVRLAEMLTEVALRLKGEFHVPGAS